jgi:hypothetical protein
MHEADTHESGARRAITQAQADTCCASSERDDSSQPPTVSVGIISSAVLGSAIVLPTSVPALVLSDAWRTVTPAPAGPVPRHVLLSVFLV